MRGPFVRANAGLATVSTIRSGCADSLNVSGRAADRKERLIQTSGPWRGEARYPVGRPREGRPAPFPPRLFGIRCGPRSRVGRTPTAAGREISGELGTM